jgi:hypothetical protein
MFQAIFLISLSPANFARALTADVETGKLAVWEEDKKLLEEAAEADIIGEDDAAIGMKRAKRSRK